MIKHQFIIDAKGKKKAVILSLKEFKELLEDLEDLTLIAERRGEPAEPLEDVIKRLEASWQKITT
ncbi:MAG: hypothetical protein EXR50_06310 [Dehalococcoidia bacterium]|nr:hypothetical protein [Dehalococcoidia bacterium]